MAPVWRWVHWGGSLRPLYSYGLCLSLAMLAGGLLFLWAAYRKRWDMGASIALLGTTALGGLLGARLLFAAVAVSQGATLQVSFVQGGAVFYGGLGGGAVAMALGAKWLGLPLRPCLDVAVVPLAVGHAIGRVGCLLGGCCYGAPFSGPWAVAYASPHAPLHDGVLRHPWPLYEAASVLLLALSLALWRSFGRQGDWRAGRLAGYYLCGYGGLRFLLEHLRGDAVRGLYGAAGVSTSQWVSILAGGIAMGLLWRWRCLPGT